MLFPSVGIENRGSGNLCGVPGNVAGTLKQRFMMIHFGWPVFGLCSGVFLVVYFAVIGWLYFRKDAQSFFKNKQKQEPGEEETPELAGRIAPERGMSNVSLNDLDFGREDQQADVPDLLEELKWF